MEDILTLKLVKHLPSIKMINVKILSLQYC